jgi:hypothetical protein
VVFGAEEVFKPNFEALAVIYASHTWHPPSQTQKSPKQLSSGLPFLKIPIHY